MSTAALIIVFVLAAQVGSTDDRYSVSGNVAEGTASSIGPPPAGEAAAGQVKKTEPPPGANRFGASAPPTGAANPITQQPNTPATGSQPFIPLDNAAPRRTTGEAQSPYPSFQSQSQSSPSATSGTLGLKPSAMMKQMLAPPPGAQLTGNSTKLLDVVTGARSRHEQAHRIEAYWDLCSSVADYYLGIREQDDLRQLPSILPRAGATLQQAQAEFEVRLGTSRLAAVASQRRLASIIGSGGTSLPLPADLPHCGSYKTHYQEIFSSRPSVEAQELAALLSSRYSELKDAATAVTRAQAWIGEVARNDSGEGIETLRALELLALRRRAFVQIARDYNRRIARYTELSTPGDIGAERLVGMLIKVSAPPTASRPKLPASTNGRRSRSSNSTPPRTFASDEGWESVDRSVARESTRDESVKPAAAEERIAPRQERSLLVTPP